MSKRLRISLVIPAYNEQRHLRACLDSVAVLDELPYEVIVVDNNSTDDTAAIARLYPFVRLLREPRQGIVFARNAGFDAARGDIIARVDADTVVAADWTARLHQQFSSAVAAKQPLDAVGGLAWAPLLPSRSFGFSRFWPQLYLWWSSAYFGVPILSGANLAVRRELWQRVRNDVCLDAQLVHEDQDLSLLIAAHGGRVRTDRRLLVLLDDSTYYQWGKFKSYMQQRWRTKAHHRARGSYRQFCGQATRLSAVRRVGLLLCSVPGAPFLVAGFIVDLPGIIRRATRAAVAAYRNVSVRD